MYFAIIKIYCDALFWQVIYKGKDITLSAVCNMLKYFLEIGAPLLHAHVGFCFFDFKIIQQNLTDRQLPEICTNTP